MPDGGQLAIQATIKRATLAAHRAVESLDREALDDLQAVYRKAAADITARIALHAGADGNLALAELRSALAQIEGELARLSALRDQLLATSLQRAANLGLQPLTSTGALSADAGMRIATEALEFVRTFVAEDGLQLSDRIWRLDRGARDRVINGIEQAVIQGHSAQQAARELLMRGMPVPGDLQDKVNAANVPALGKTVSDGLITGPGSPMDNAMRLMRTEINRAHGEAYMKGGESTRGFAGWRYLLSPAHPAPDICLRAGSLVLTRRGPVPVELVKEGDEALTHRGRYRRVTRLYRSASGPTGLIRLCCPEENNRNRELVMTPNHPVLTPSGWQAAGDLRTGDAAIALTQWPHAPAQQSGADANRTNAPGSVETASAGVERTSAPELHDEGADAVSRIPHSPAAGAVQPILRKRSGAPMRQWFGCRLSMPGSPRAAALSTTTAGMRPNARTFPDVADRNSDSACPRAGSRRLNSISDFYGNSLTKMFFCRLRKLWIALHGLCHNTPSSKTPASAHAPDEPAPQKTCDRSDTSPRPDGRRFATAPRSNDCRSASSPSEPRAPTVLAWVAGALHRIHSIVLRPSLTPCVFSPKHTIVEFLPPTGETVFNLEVEEDHSYVANGIVVHNCDLLSTQNLHGLGPGVYPDRARTPWPAHPNTLSFIVMVFESEITDADRAGKETPLQALQRLTPAQRIGVLGKGKTEIFEAGKLRQGMIRTPLRSVARKITRLPEE